MRAEQLSTLRSQRSVLLMFTNVRVEKEKFPCPFKVSDMLFSYIIKVNAISSTISTGGTLEILLFFRPLPGVEEEVSSRSPPPLMLLEGEVALLLFADIA